MYEKLQYISQATERLNHLESIDRACRAGVKWIQLRVKDASEKEVEKLAQHTKKICEKYDATFILNDHVELAKKVDADGVHVGQHDMPVERARKIMGDKKIIGGSANTFDMLHKHMRAGANYVGVGPFRFTETKKNLDPILGIEGYKKMVQDCQDHKINLPMYAIGGILAKDISSIIETGVYGVAISGAITTSIDPAITVNEIKRGFMKKV